MIYTINQHIDSIQMRLNPVYREIVEKNDTIGYCSRVPLEFLYQEKIECSVRLFKKNKDDNAVDYFIIQIPLKGESAIDDQYNAICQYFTMSYNGLYKKEEVYPEYYGNLYFNQFELFRTLIDNVNYAVVVYGQELYDSEMVDHVQSTAKVAKNLDDYIESAVQRNEVGTYRLYPTNNMYNFIKLNTVTGEMRLVQWSINDDKEFSYSLNDRILLSYGQDEIIGRYELVPTTNHYTFLLLDTISGMTWHVQWSFEANECFVNRIF